MITGTLIMQKEIDRINAEYIRREAELLQDALPPEEKLAKLEALHKERKEKETRIMRRYVCLA